MADPTKRCSVEGCERPLRARGWCKMHYHRWQANGDVGPAAAIRERCGGTCVVEGCTTKPLAKHMCGKHYQRWTKFGDPNMGSRATGRTWLGQDGYVLTWDPGAGYGHGRAIPQHRLVMERRLGRPLRRFETVHHINGIRTDNRSENLELWCKPHVPGRRPDDLAEWVVEHYPELVWASLDKRNQLRLVV